ncbi:LysR family transcriptional regulator [Xanthomonas arboricola]|nr:LysR family transcriptional regulator [Xanthomonas arboricola]
MEIRQLRKFVTVVQERSFTRAAERLHIAQPSLSKQIQLIEQELGVRLIQRNSRPLGLTEQGKRFYEDALQVIARIDRMTSQARQPDGAAGRVVTIGFVASTLYGGLPTVIRRLRKANSLMEVRWIEMTSADQVAALKTRRIDLGFGRVRTEDPAVERVILREERLMIAMPADSPLSHTSAPALPRELKGVPLIVYPNDPRPSFADQVLSLLHDHGVRPSEVHEVRELQTALGLVAVEAGVCLIPASARHVRPELRYRLVDDDAAVSPIIMAHRRSSDEELVEEIKSITREMYAEGPLWLEPSYNRIPSF